jgi:predicted phosphodiesterase
LRVLVIADIHANLTGFEAVLEDAKGQWDYVWCLGDVIGFGPDPNECVELLQTLPHLCLAGNHEWIHFGRIDIQVINADAKRRVEWTRKTLTPTNAAYLENLPSKQVIGDYTLVHASPREPVWEYILDPLVAARNFPHFETRYCLIGHTHLPVIFELDADNGEVEIIQPAYRQPRQLSTRKQIINPGSVGHHHKFMEDASYALLDLSSNIFEHRLVPYDGEAVRERMRQFGLV